MVDTSPFLSRFEQALEALGLPRKADLARLLGVQSQHINNWLQRERIGDPSRRLFQAKTGISVDWLNDGAGTMWLNRAAVREESDEAYLRPIQSWNDPGELPAEEFVFLPVLDYHLSAGRGGPDPNTVEKTDKAAAFRADFMASRNWSPRTHYTMRANGESMEPTIQDGAPVVIATNERMIKSGRIYAILIDGEPLLKRLDKLPGGFIRVRSDNTANPEFTAFEVPEASIEVIGRAVWTPINL